MNNIKEILEFRFSQNSFSEKGKNIVPTHVLNLCQSRISTLTAITEKIGNSMIDEKPTNGIREVYLKFIKFSQSNNGFNDKFDKRELRTLTYALTYKEHQEDSIFENSHYLRQCISLLNENWRDSFVSGLLDCYLSNWGSSNKESFNILSNFLTFKIKSYEGSRSLFQSLKTNSKFFDKDKGDLDLGATLAISNKSISEATKFLSLPEHWITYTYFSGVITSFYQKSKNKLEVILEDISSAIEKHSGGKEVASEFNKTILSKMIIQCKNETEVLQDKIKDIALNLVGDPATPRWDSYGNPLIKEGREILNIWITKQFINVFFQICINDRRRRLFWLKYSPIIKQFKVFGPYTTKQKLLKDSRISKFVNERYKIVDSNKEVSAFMFLIGDHKMIEFSDSGYAFYAYKATNSAAPSFDAKYVSSVDNFIDGSMPMLVYRKGYDPRSFSEEGRQSHKDETMKWEDVFSIWLKIKAGINV
jgi:hypothetical protein